MGANIVLNGRQGSDSIDSTAKEFEEAGINVAVTKGDVRNSDDVAAMVKTAVEVFGSVDILEQCGYNKRYPYAKNE